jgi:hypothetical protein
MGNCGDQSKFDKSERMVSRLFPECEAVMTRPCSEKLLELALGIIVR